MAGFIARRFYDKSKIAIMPMDFCYSGTGKSGDLPPCKECAELWHEKLLTQLPGLKLTLLIGENAQKYYLNDRPLSLTKRLEQWPIYLSEHLPLPHPSPRNQLWLKKNPWFEQDLFLNTRSSTIDGYC